MNAGQKRYRQHSRRPAMGIGTTSLLVIFTILCLATLALLSLSTAMRSQRISQRSFQLTQGRATAEGQAAQRIAEIDGVLARLAQQETTGTVPTDTAAGNAPEDVPAQDELQAYYRQAAQALQGQGCQVNTQTGIVSFTLPINDKNDLVTQLQLLAPGGARRYAVVAQQMVISGEWVPEEEGNVWQGVV